MIFSQKNVIWFKIFFCKPKNSNLFHTFAKVFLWRVRIFVAHSAKTRLKLCFLKKNYSSSQSKNGSEFIKFKERITCFKKFCHTCKHRLQFPQCCRKFFCRKSENFPPVVQKLINFFGNRSKLFPRQKKLPDLKNTVSITVSKTFRKTSELFPQCPKTAMQNVSRKKFFRRSFYPDK